MVARRPWDVPDGLWELIEPLLPRTPRRFRHPGRRRLGDREALQGILFVLYTGIAWRHLPLELGFGSGATCRRRLDEWQAAGVWDKLHALLLDRLQQAGELEWSRVKHPGFDGGSDACGRPACPRPALAPSSAGAISCVPTPTRSSPATSSLSRRSGSDASICSPSSSSTADACTSQAAPRPRRMLDNRAGPTACLSERHGPVPDPRP
jgi:transposase